MTRGGIEGLVEAWVPRLGLSHWAITVEWDIPADEFADAQMASEDAYDRATLYLGADYDTWNEAKAERLIVHELTHLVTRDLEAVGEAIQAILEGPALTLAKARFEHELEGVVDRVAVALVAIARHSCIEGLQCS